MSVLRALGRTLRVGVRATALLTAGGIRGTRYAGRGMLAVRRRGGAGEAGMLRLLDLHAASCAGDTLVAIGLAGTVFFALPAGEARGPVALYLVVTMLPFALLAPVIGPVLDGFRHGRRYALATTMLGRAFLAYMISEHVGGLTLYPAAFGMLVLSRAYGVARSAAVPRLLPAGMGLSAAGARASVYGTFAGAAVVPVGIALYALGPAWPLRASMLIFVLGMVTALRLPPRADSDPPERLPRALQPPGQRGVKILSGRVVLTTLAGSATLRALYGFLALYLAFAIRTDALSAQLAGTKLSQPAALGAVAGALAIGSFIATAIGTRLRIHRPAILQATGIVAVAVLATLTALFHTLPAVLALCLVTAVASGLAKLTVDAVIQERIAERVRATAFAHSETLLMLAWVAGGGLGLVPFDGPWGFYLAAGLTIAGAARAVVAAIGQRRDRLHGTPAHDPPPGAEPDRTTEEPAQPTRVGWRRRNAARRAGISRASPSDVGLPSDVTGAQRARGGGSSTVATPAPSPRSTVETDEFTINSPGFHLYRPSGLDRSEPVNDPDETAG